MSVFVGSNTRLAALLGYPAEHSLSPEIHNLAYRTMDVDACYVTANVPPSQLGDALRGLAALGAMGCSVTAPYKEAVFELLGDKATPWARALRAVNTVRFLDNALIDGGNTDAYGWMKSWDEEVGESLVGREVYLLGAGGAARAVLAALLCRGAGHVTVVNRTRERAEAMVEQLVPALESLETSNVVQAPLRAGVSIFQYMLCSPFDNVKTPMEHLHRRVAVADSVGELGPNAVVVQATSLGMPGNAEATPMVWPRTLAPGVVACDLIYNPMETRFMREAREHGAKTLGGLGMLVNQAAASIYTWTQRQAPVERMRHAAEVALASGSAV